SPSRSHTAMASAVSSSYVTPDGLMTSRSGCPSTPGTRSETLPAVQATSSQRGSSACSRATRSFASSTAARMAGGMRTESVMGSSLSGHGAHGGAFDLEAIRPAIQERRVVVDRVYVGRDRDGSVGGEDPLGQPVAERRLRRFGAGMRVGGQHGHAPRAAL